MGSAQEQIRQLSYWKREATAVLEQWERVWEEAGKPGRLGQSKSDAVLELIRRMRAEIGS